jgi:hypothetical protein
MKLSGKCFTSQAMSVIIVTLERRIFQNLVYKELKVAKNKPKYDTEVTDTSVKVEAVRPEVDAETTEVKTPKTPKLGYHLALNGVGYVFAKRDWLKREHPTVAATIDGQETTVVIITAREFADNRVWIKLPNGDCGRFLVPKDVDLTGPMDIKIVEGAIEYKREELRVRPKVERKKKDVTPAAEGEQVADEAEAEASE